MRAFSGAILEPERDVPLPTVARIYGKSLILFSSRGAVEEWPLDRVKIIVVGNGYFEVVAEDRRLSLLIDEPEAFEEALEAEWAVEAKGPASRGAPIEGREEEPNRLTRFVSQRPRHGRARVRPLPLAIIVVAVLTLGYLVGTVIGDLIDLATTESPEPLDTPQAEIVVRTFQGSGDDTSAPFAVVGLWRVEWSVEGPADARLEVQLLDEDDVGDVLGVQEGPGEGVATLRQGGVFQLEMSSTGGAAWSVRVVEIVNPDSR